MNGRNWMNFYNILFSLENKLSDFKSVALIYRNHDKNR